MKPAPDASDVKSGQFFTFWGLIFLDKFSLEAEAILLAKELNKHGAL